MSHEELFSSASTRYRIREIARLSIPEGSLNELYVAMTIMLRHRSNKLEKLTFFIIFDPK